MKIRAVLYLCDGKACGEGAYCGPRGEGECWHTASLEHALHPDRDTSEFVTLQEGEDTALLVEPRDD